MVKKIVFLTSVDKTLNPYAKKKKKSKDLESVSQHIQNGPET